jgi:hypothetical protein
MSMTRSISSAAAGILVAVLVSGCAPPLAVSSTPAHTVTVESARAIAQKVAVAEGYAPDVFVVRSVEKVGPGGGSFAGMWRVEFEHVPPVPPGGHFTVYVDPAGKTQVFHGE